MIVIIYMMNYIDVCFLRVLQPSKLTILHQRSGITTARLQGMEQDLHITGIVCCFDMKKFLILSRCSICYGRRSLLCILLSRPDSFKYGWFILFVGGLWCRLIRIV
jgi:hypothetical protein